MFEKINEGDDVTVEAFEVGDVLTISGVSKGKGFQGVVRHLPHISLDTILRITSSRPRHPMSSRQPAPCIKTGHIGTN